MGNFTTSSYVYQTNTIGLDFSSPVIVDGGHPSSYAVLAHQVDWRGTIFAGTNIDDYEGTGATRLLNAIEEHIYNNGTNNHTNTGTIINKIGTTESSNRIVMGCKLSADGKYTYTYMNIWGEL